MDAITASVSSKTVNKRTMTDYRFLGQPCVLSRGGPLTPGLKAGRYG